MTAEETLPAIAAILDDFGESDAYYNLEGAIQDIERTGKCDGVSLATLKRVQDQIGRVMQLLPRSRGSNG